MFFTGCLYITALYSVSLPWSGGAYWALLRPTSMIFAIPSRAPEVTVPSDQWNVLSLLPVLQPVRLVHSRRQALCLEWTSIGPLALRLLPRVHSDTFYS